MAWQKVAAKAATSLLSSKASKGGENVVVALIAIPVIIMLPVILIIAMFTGGNGGVGETDLYVAAFNKTDCDNSYFYQMEDVRFFDQYTYPEDVEPDSVDMLTKRLQTDYLIIEKPNNPPTSNPSTGGGAIAEGSTCFLKKDEDIYQMLVTKYGVDEVLKEEILESVQQIRNGRADFMLPIEGSATIVADFETSNKMTGVQILADKGSNVLAVGDGTIEEIVTSESGYYFLNDKDEITLQTKGLTVTVKHTVQKGVNQSGDYDETIMYSHYTNLKDVKWNVGDELKRSDIIGVNNKKDIYFELWKADKEIVDPSRHMFIRSVVSGIGGNNGETNLPLEQPFTVTSEAGVRDLDGFHYGIDISKAFGATVYSISAGEVVYSNSGCAANNGGTPSTCPSDGPVTWGGNSVVIKSKIGDREYYIQYDHLSKPTVSQGDMIGAGQAIGFQGNSGNSYGSHLHLEIHTGGINTANLASFINPRDLVKFP